MKILVIPSWYPPNGGRFFANQTQWLIEKGLVADVVTIEEIESRRITIESLLKQRSIRKASENGILTYRKVLNRLPKLHRLNSKRFINKMVKLVNEYIKNEGIPDIIQTHSCMWAGLVASIIKKKFDIPYIITEHRGRFNSNSLTQDEDLHSWLFSDLGEALRNANYIIPVSKNQIKILEEIANQKLEFTAIPNPVDENVFTICPIKSKDNRSIHLLNISMFNKWKAIDKLLRAFEKALLKNSNLKLHLVGDGPDRMAMELLAAKLKIQDNITFYGVLEPVEIHKKICDCDALVISSITEGQPVVVGETLLSGRPIIATSVVSQEDLPEECGIIVPAGNIEQLAEGILKFCENQSYYSPERIRKFAMGRFAKSIVIPQIIDIMETVVKNH